MEKHQNVSFFSLQVGGDEAFPNVGIKDFSDTAAVISLMDAVIVCDTSVANLCGAMGKETWLMDRKDYDWRWRKPDWFPTARVFRQPEYGDWESVIEKIDGAISELSANIHSTSEL